MLLKTYSSTTLLTILRRDSGFTIRLTFNMRRKILIALQLMSKINNVCLREVSELDEIFVPDAIMADH